MVGRIGCLLGIACLLIGVTSQASATDEWKFFHVKNAQGELKLDVVQFRNDIPTFHFQCGNLSAAPNAVMSLPVEETEKGSLAYVTENHPVRLGVRVRFVQRSFLGLSDEVDDLHVDGELRLLQTNALAGLLGGWSAGFLGPSYSLSVEGVDAVDILLKLPSYDELSISLNKPGAEDVTVSLRGSVELFKTLIATCPWN